MRIGESEKKILIALAARSIAEEIAPTLNQLKVEVDLTDALKCKCGAFVSIYVDQDLRGCIGTFSEEEALYKNVRNMAVSAATSDSRFYPVQAHELEQIVLEISILTPRHKISDPSEIIIGKHGIFIKLGANRGTLLPQVAVNQKWTVEEFLGNCSKYKAGIGWNGWKAAGVFTYEAIVFKSESPPQSVKNL